MPPGDGCPRGLGVATAVAGSRWLRRPLWLPGRQLGRRRSLTARSRSRGLPARRGRAAGLARIVDAQLAPMMTIFELMVRLLAERVAARLRPLVLCPGWRAAGRRPARR